jgi:predicted Fe-Mo cluster-binding NifX family protein
MTVKIAAATEDQRNITSHFGRAPLYRVLTLDGSRIIDDEVREKAYHDQQEPGHHIHDNLHADMFAPITDCQVLLCGGMGVPAFEKAQSAGLQVILAGGEIETAVQSYLNGQLTSDLRRIHHH